MNGALIIITGFSDGKKVSAFIDFGQQPLPRIGEELAFQGLRTRVVNVIHELDPDPEQHGLTLELSALAILSSETFTALTAVNLLEMGVGEGGSVSELEIDD